MNATEILQQVEREDKEKKDNLSIFYPNLNPNELAVNVTKYFKVVK